MELIIIILLIVLGCKSYKNWSFNNRVSPPNMCSDVRRMNNDLFINNVSEAEVKRRYRAGYYDVPADKLGLPKEKDKK